jgi:hypothetical protein
MNSNWNHVWYWYLLALLVAAALSWVVSNIYSDHCRVTERDPFQHGALEANLTFFSITTFVLAYASDSIMFALIGATLAAILIRRFLVNWIE